MGFWKKLFGDKKGKTEYTTEVDETQYYEVSNFTDNSQRERYIESCLEQMKAASDEIDLLNREYDSVTAYLNDTEEIDRLPEHIKNPIRDCATKLLRLEREFRNYSAREDLLSNEDYALMERLEDEMPEGYEKLKQGEEYRKLVKEDMKRIEGEKQAYYFRKAELKGMLANIKGVFFICVVAAVTCVIMLAILQFGFELDTRIGYILTAGAAAIAFTVLFVKNIDMQQEYSKVEKSIGKLIHMHNTVKIRFVNNTNLLEYLYMKYNVESSKELKELWDKYVSERAERERFEQTKYDITFYRDELLQHMRKLHIVDPDIWLHQAEALVDRKEMVEIRHGLVERRQSLRKQMEYNKDIAVDAQTKLKDMIHAYPQYANQVLQQLEEFERKAKSRL
ncbi:MAG: hypothetical protein J6A73_05285 [Lachnospiraceae bacterium]|nr:hypothetical protein [Lachnospiraceae bacterium]